MSPAQIVSSYPTQIVDPLSNYSAAEDGSAIHKSLLDLGESLLSYIVGMMFGEYKRSSAISEKLETELYKYSSRPPSFGVFLSFLRLLSKEMPETIVKGKFDKSLSYAKVSEFCSEFSLLKQVIDQGRDAEFADQVEDLREGRTLGQKGLMDFFDTFISIRNTYAHPEEKAGPKDAKRKWPLVDEYFNFINPLMYEALIEIINDFDVLKTYKPVVAKMLDDENKKGSFSVEIGKSGDESAMEMELNPDELKFVNTDERYLVDPSGKLFVKLYYHTLPQLNVLVAKKIIDAEKAKTMEPHLLDMIRSKLEDDAKIDEMEYLILKDTSKISSISEERLFQLIEKVKNQLGLEGSVGSPENKGDIFSTSGRGAVDFAFNPWWLYYFSMAGKIDKGIVADEKKRGKELDKKISKIKKEKKDNPVNSKLENWNAKLREAKTKKRKTVSDFDLKIKKKREALKKSNDNERKVIIRAGISELQEKLELKRQDIDHKIQQAEDSISELKSKQGAKFDEIDLKIEAMTEERQEHSTYSQWGVHKHVWKELNQYVEYLLGKNLNAGTVESDEDDTALWVNSPNAWQIGNLTYTYWAKIHPKQAPLGMIHNVGYAVSQLFKWVPREIDPTIAPLLRKPCSILWITVDDDAQAKVDPEGVLPAKKAELTSALIDSYATELLNLGVSVSCTPKEASGQTSSETLIPLEKYLENRNELNVEQAYSRVWNIEKFYQGGAIDFDALSKYEEETVTVLQLFSNVILQLNDYALERGINQETITERNDHFNRMKLVLFQKFEKDYPKGTPFKPTSEETTEFRNFALYELGLNEHLYKLIFAQFRW